MKCLAVIMVFVLTLVFSQAVTAVEDKFHFDDPAKAALFLDLTKDLRCPQCQNQNIADSDAMIAVDLRRKVHELVAKDYDKQQVIDFMKARYGDFVYYQPPVNSMTIWLWLLPALFIVMAVVGVIVTRKTAKPQMNESQLAKADELLERDE